MVADIVNVTVSSHVSCLFICSQIYFTVIFGVVKTSIPLLFLSKEGTVEHIVAVCYEILLKHPTKVLEILSECKAPPVSPVL